MSRGETLKSGRPAMKGNYPRPARIAASGRRAIRLGTGPVKQRVIGVRAWIGIPNSDLLRNGNWLIAVLFRRRLTKTDFRLSTRGARRS